MDSAMYLDDIKLNADRYAADELGFRDIIDAQRKSPKLFNKIREQRISHLCNLFSINTIPKMEQVDMFSL